MPQTPAPRKRLRLGLWIPLLIALLLAVGWSVAWRMAAQEVERRLDEGVQTLAARGVAAEWSERRLSGYPFRLNVTLTDLRVTSGGWGLRIPDFEAQAFLHAPRSWLTAAPEGLTLFRPEGGGLEVRGDRLLSSLVLPSAGPPRLSIEGLGLVFTPAPGARPFALTSAARLELHVRPGPEDKAAVFLRLQDGTPTPGRLLADIGGGASIAATAEGRLERASRLRGADLSGALGAWGVAGGKLEILQAGLTAGETRRSLTSPDLSAGADGRFRGSLRLTAARAPTLLIALARHGVLSPTEAAGGLVGVLAGRNSGEDLQVDLTLSEGKVRLSR